MQFSEKGRTFSKSFAKFLEFTSNFKHFETKDYRQRKSISEIRDCENLG